MLSVPHLVRTADTDTMPSLCMDGMETMPVEDDLTAIEISMDGGCMLSETPISI